MHSLPFLAFAVRCWTAPWRAETDRMSAQAAAHATAMTDGVWWLFTRNAHYPVLR
jgi:hypothetical protein